MLRIIYKFINGEATDLRFVSYDYVLGVNEKEISGSELPELNSLHSLTHLKSLRCDEVKTIAESKILAIVPVTKQRNLIAKSVFLRRKEFKNTITSAELTELNNLETLWTDNIDVIRNTSNDIETEINALSTKQRVLDYDIENSPLWTT
jgi:hypothetical protein